MIIAALGTGGDMGIRHAKGTRTKKPAATDAATDKTEKHNDSIPQKDHKANRARPCRSAGRRPHSQSKEGKK